MSAPAPGRTTLRFGPFEVDVRARQLKKRGIKIRLQQQPFQVLILLLEHAGEVVTRDELQKAIWPADTFVDFDLGLATAIHKLRQAVGDSAESPRYVETLPKRGYRFIGTLEADSSGDNKEGISILTPSGVAPIEQLGVASSKPTHLLVLGLGAILLICAISIPLVRTRFWPSQPAIHAVAVLPFSNLSGDPLQDYFADGITDELTTDLAKIGALQVLSRTSATRYRNTQIAVPEIARQLKVDAIVEGSIVPSGNRIRITAQLINASNDRHLWAESYDTDVSDILNVQNTVALSIARQIRAFVSPAERDQLALHSTVVPEAYDAYLRGRQELSKQRQEPLRKGLQYFEQAIALDRLYAPAYAGLADSYTLLVNYNALPPIEAFPRAKAAALKALELDHNLAEAHTSLAYIKHHYDWDWAGAEAEYKLAIQLDSSNAITHLRYAELLSNLARHDEAIREVKLAHDLDPLSLVIQANVGRLLFQARRYDDAITELQKVLAADPHRAFARISLAQCYEQKGLYSESLNEFEKVRSEFNGQSGVGYAELLAHLGKKNEVMRLLSFLEQPQPDGAELWVFIGAIYAQLGQKDKAFSWLNQAYQNRDFFISFLKTEPTMDPLRSDPRFTELLRRLRLQ